MRWKLALARHSDVALINVAANAAKQRRRIKTCEGCAASAASPAGCSRQRIRLRVWLLLRD